jgi:KaiC/GvpD/RAD55 family RecA-like ATPase
MARPKKTKIIEEVETKEDINTKASSKKKSILDEAFASLKKMNDNSGFLAENAQSIVSEFVDTGSLGLNAIVSGSFFKGIPKGRITGLVGPSGCGKTLIANQIIANAQKKDPDVWAVVWDSENAFDAQMAKSMNANINKIKHCPVETVEACRNEISTFLDNIKKDKSLHGKIIIVIDSLGNLASTKELEDAAKGKTAVDMGLRAKTCLDPNTQVLMADGTYKKIKNIKKGDKVVTHLKRIKKIEDKWDTLHKKIITIKTKNDEIKLSLTHKLLINRNGDFKYIQAKDIKKTDKLVKIT